ncbi:unnamed protein product [Prorocentrum cordatum]|uniref:Granulins domain-containing protein n=1 Tax=Prorocentrum cordatum TaxID=2364126 RepID=A0ABN9VBF6_9DINO|nr:unnamed protein product [Polarella glacialis]
MAALLRTAACAAAALTLLAVDAAGAAADAGCTAPGCSAGAERQGEAADENGDAPSLLQVKAGGSAEANTTALQSGESSSSRRRGLFGFAPPPDPWGIGYSSVQCQGSNGVHLTCAYGQVCCGPICMSPGGTCCRNRNGDYFACADNNICCKDICIAPNSICCTNEAGYGFGCAGSNQCCGNSCQAPGATCCPGNNNLPPYPVVKGTACVR